MTTAPMFTTAMPADIVEMVDLLASIEGKTGDEYAARWWVDVRAQVAMRGGIEAVRQQAKAARDAEAVIPDTSED